MSSDPVILVERREAVTRVTINRAKVLNALNAEVISALQTTFEEEIASGKCRLLILKGAGSRAFVAGADISAMAKMDAAEARAFAEKGQNLGLTLEKAPFLSLAVVQGFALGGGCELAMSCDLVLASPAARFGQPETGLGLIAGFGGTQRLVRRTGLPVALDLLCTGRQLTGSEARDAGLVSRLAEDLEKAEEDIIKGVLKMAPEAIAASKKLTHTAFDQPLAGGLQHEAAAFAACFDREESKEGMAAFLEKRAARFSG